MKHYPARIIGLFSLLTSMSWSADDAYIKASAPAIVYTEISRKVTNVGERTVTYVKVRPPVPRKAPPPPPPAPLTEAQQARLAEWEAKTHAVLNLTANVYLNGGQTVTELRWRDESGALGFVAWSNADFRLLTQLHYLETETTVYSWFPFVFVHDLASRPADEEHAPLPSGLDFSDTEAEYILDESLRGRSDQETTLAGIDYLLAYYQIHKVALKAAYEQRMQEAAEAERKLRENPPEKQDETVRYWKIATPAAQP